MGSLSIQGRVDSKAWAELKQPGETNTNLLQRLLSHYQATSGNELAAIAQTPAAAIAILLNSHTLFTQLLSNAAIALPPQPTDAEPTYYDDAY